MEKPKMDKVTEKGLDELEQTQESMKKLTVDEINKAPVKEQEPYYRFCNAEKKSDAIRIKPTKTFSPRSKPDSREQAAREKAWESVEGYAENREVIGEPICFWLDKYKGDPTCYWEIPCGIKVSLPRFVAQHLASRTYTRFKMNDMMNVEEGTRAPRMVVEEKINRLNFHLSGLNT